jgi:hypothetical protein
VTPPVAPHNQGLTDHFGLVLASCLLTYTLLVTVNSPRWDALVGVLPVVVTVLLTIRVSAAKATLGTPAIVLIAAAGVLAVVNAARHGPDPAGVSLMLTGLALGVALVAMLARMALHTRVTVRTVMAVLASYVMLGLLFAYVDSGVGHVANNFFAQQGQHSQSDYSYFSYITLTTVGYGDLTPLTGIARSLAILEALAGQIFLVTLVARMVSLFGTERAPLNLRDRRNLRQEIDDREVASGDGPALPPG